MRKLITGIILTAALIINSTTQIKAQTFNFDAKSYILIDSKTGYVICEHNADQQVYPASTTKIMTAILGIENAKPDDIMTVSQYAIDNIGPGGMNIGLLPGEQLTFKDLLNALLVRSANETAFVIAENIGPTVDAFMKKMNERAKELGALNTNFVNPCGMDTDESAKNHLTTARDLALMAKYAMTLPLFRETVKKTSCTIPPTNKHEEEIILPSTNKLFQARYKSEYYTEVTGIKTGYTNRALFTLVASAANEDGMELISVILGCPTDAIYQYTKELLEYGFKNYSQKNLIAENTYVTSVTVADASFNPNLDLVAAEDFKCILPNDPDAFDSVSKNIKVKENITAPVKKGTVLGSVEFVKDGFVLGEVNLIASRDIEKLIPTPVPSQKIMSTVGNSRTFKTLKVLFFIVVGFLILRFILRKISRRRRMNRLY
ncbi:D-alanyl-D-alanine carboxypeptidase family protein [Acetivibrio clariflavus]|uniref:serine-type D-Ala-D-Ala carboxypeptidase n=1 Tax=Acetivibrio clariflavus (strain DSM 19732 / NBRC 101661 / EBR45) TaxID=720554 RepID=G8LUZ9_ACECE|nr:D-alanyl-D-alanine carboxypeptidase family protein [Acetivibrio clariflavus]AEV69576.1 D-alanyl-D-alanine carboxypeptidase [Acetivibrio clariflavus DSM 19732]